jgi:hypothetical protein
MEPAGLSLSEDRGREGAIIPTITRNDVIIPFPLQIQKKN